MKTVDSSKIDISAIAHLFEDPEIKNIERLAQLFKEESEKSESTALKHHKLDFNYPLVHGRETLNLVCELLKVDVSKVKSKSKKTELADARFIISFLLMRYSTIKISLVNVGNLINRDHATVLNAVKKTIDYNQTSKDFRKKLDMCIAEYTQRFYNSGCFIDYNNIAQL